MCSSDLQHLDFAPTLLEATGAHIPPNMEGKSLWGLATGQTESGGWDRIIACESTWQSKWALRTETTKLILAREPDQHFMPKRELYDLTTDPEETHNLAQERPEVADAMEQELEEWIAAGLAKVGRSEDPLRTQGITLGKRWNQWLQETANRTP